MYIVQTIEITVGHLYRMKMGRKGQVVRRRARVREVRTTLEQLHPQKRLQIRLVVVNFLIKSYTYF